MSTILDDLRKPCLPLTDAAADEIEALESELAQLRAEVEAMREDADRYRWLRDVEEGSVAWIAASCIVESPTNEWDSAIDAARKAQQ